jgi:hypothetical protein
MTRTFYSLAVFTTGLHTALYVIQGIVYFLVGHLIYTLDIFFRWYLLYNVLIFLGLFVYLKYFRQKNYQLPFWTLLVNLVAIVFSFVVFVGAISGKTSWVRLYMVAETISLLTGILFGLALIISEAGKRRWLKLTGIFFAITGVALMVPSVWYLNSNAPDKAVTLETIVQWILLFSFPGPLMMLLNFLDEKKQLPPHDANLPLPVTGENWINAIKFISVLLTLFLSLTLAGQAVARLSFESKLVQQTKHWDKVWGAQTFASARGDTLRYQLITPQDYDSATTYPMVVCLPYGGGIEGAPPAKFLLEEANRKKYPSYLFVPFCPNGIGWGGIPNYPTMDTLVFDAIESIEQEMGSIDADRVYISGVSRGGYGSWHFISLRPDLFAAAMPVCGAGDTTMAGNVIDVAIWAFHGENDHNVPVRGSRDMIEAIKKSGGNPKYTEFEGAGHDIWNFITKTPGSFDWLFEQKRKQAKPVSNL